MKKRSSIFRAAAALMCLATITSCTSNAGSDAQTSAQTAAASEQVTEETAAETTETSAEASEDVKEDSADTEESEEENTIPLTDLTIKAFFTFEDDDISAFTVREGDDTQLFITSEVSKGGSKCMVATSPSGTWNRPAIRLDQICEPYEEYVITASVMTREHGSVSMMMQYTDESGEVFYENLAKKSGDDWLSFTQISVGYTPEMKDVYVYFEGDASDMFIDNFNVAMLPSANIQNELTSLSDHFEGDFKVGTALVSKDFSTRGTMALTEKHFGDSLTAGNEMKPDYVLDLDATLAYLEETGDDENPQISFSRAKPILSYCSKNKVPMRIHTLVWHSQTPTWFFKEGYDMAGEWVSPEKMTKRMENYIKNYFETLRELYPDIEFYACDVVNEAWLEDGKPRLPGCREEDSEQHSPWVKVYGDNSFIELAFTFARKYAPAGCKLYYNDYNEYMDVKMHAIYDMAEDFKEKGIIDGIGMQSHLDVRSGPDAFPSVAMYNKALDVYSELGLDIQITELDATVNAGSGDSLMQAQADYYKGIMNAIYEHRDNVSALIVWGVTDDKSWRSAQQPLLFDRKYQAKPAFYSILEVKE